MELESIATKGVSFIRVSTALCDKFELRKVTNFSGYSANKNCRHLYNWNIGESGAQQPYYTNPF